MSLHAPCHNAQPKCTLLSLTSLYMLKTNPNSGHTGRQALPPSIALHLHPTISVSQLFCWQCCESMDCTVIPTPTMNCYAMQTGCVL